MTAIDFGFVEEVESTLSQLLGELEKLDQGMTERESPQTEPLQFKGAERLAERFAEWQTRLESICSEVSSVERELESSQQELRNWNEAFAQSRQQVEVLART